MLPRDHCTSVHTTTHQSVCCLTEMSLSPCVSLKKKVKNQVLRPLSEVTELRVSFGGDQESPDKGRSTSDPQSSLNSNLVWSVRMYAHWSQRAPRGINEKVPFILASDMGIACTQTRTSTARWSVTRTSCTRRVFNTIMTHSWREVPRYDRALKGWKTRSPARLCGRQLPPNSPTKASV